MSTCAIVLAAGKSRRMGTQKLLLPLGGKPMIAWVVDEILASSCEPTIVVVGEDGTAIRQAIGGRKVEFVPTDRRSEAMLASVRCGLEAVPESANSVLLALGDQPELKCSFIQQMLAAHQAHGHQIVVPVCRGRRGHPLLFSMRFREEVMSRFDETGLRGLLSRHPNQVYELPCESSSVLRDVDTPADYESRRAAFG